MLMPDPAKPEVYFNLEFNVIGGLLDNFRPRGPNRPRERPYRESPECCCVCPHVFGSAPAN
jgi:hypothetical protein